LNGIEATRQIITADPAIAVVVLSMHSDESYVLRALKAGAKAYLLKNSVKIFRVTVLSWLLTKRPGTIVLRVARDSTKKIFAVLFGKIA